MHNLGNGTWPARDAPGSGGRSEGASDCRSGTVSGCPLASFCVSFCRGRGQCNAAASIPTVTIGVDVQVATVANPAGLSASAVGAEERGVPVSARRGG